MRKFAGYVMFGIGLSTILVSTVIGFYYGWLLGTGLSQYCLGEPVLINDPLYEDNLWGLFSDLASELFSVCIGLILVLTGRNIILGKGMFDWIEEL